MVAQKEFYTFLRNPDGNRYVLYLYWNDGEWNWNYNWLDNDWNSNNPSAVLANLFISKLFRLCLKSFVWQVVHSNPQAFYLSHLKAKKEQYIFCRLKILFPKEPSRVLSMYQVFLSQFQCADVFPLLAEKLLLKQPRLFL